MLDVRVHTFLTVCQTLNYTHAAKQLNLTQSAVSQHMAYLEQYYGVKLIHKEGKSMMLTDAGRDLQRAFETMAHDAALLERKYRDSAHQELTHFNIGTTMTAGEYIAVPSLARYLVKHPEMTVSITSKSTVELMGLLRQGTIDCAFVEGFVDKTTCAYDVLCTQKLVCICAPDSPFAQGTYRVSDLLSAVLIAREPESGSRAVLQHALESQNYTLGSFCRVMEVNNINIIKTLVEEGIGISFVYEAAVEQEIANQQIVAVDLRGLPLSHEITFIRPLHSVFEDELRGFYQGIYDEFYAAS